MNNQSITSPNANANTIPNVAIKIKELSYLKQTYLKFIMQMYPLLQDPLLKDYSNQLIRLLQNIINIHKNDVLLKIEDALTSVLVTYIIDINELIKGHLNVEKYEPMHVNLTAINQQVIYHMACNDTYGLAILKEQLYSI